MMGRRHFISVEPTSVEEVVGQPGWTLGPGGDSLFNGEGIEVFFREDPEGYLTLIVEDGTDISDLRERVPFEEFSDA
jgi:hypothetical protein